MKSVLKALNSPALNNVLQRVSGDCVMAQGDLTLLGFIRIDTITFRHDTSSQE